LPEDSLENLNRRLLRFARERDWEQFHSPQWLTPEQSASLSPDKREEVAAEMADILIYLIRLSERLGVDLIAAANEKIARNEARYPVERTRGDARRASEYED